MGPATSLVARLLGCLVLALLVIAEPLFGQAPPAGHSLFMDVHVTASGSETEAGYVAKATPKSGRFRKPTEYKREKESSLTLAVDVRNLARHADAAQLEWYFFSRELDGGEEEIFDSGSQEVQLDATGTRKISLTSDTVESSVLKRRTSRSYRRRDGTLSTPKPAIEKEGSKISGWIVRLMVEGKPLVIKASSPSLQTKGATDLKPGEESANPPGAGVGGGGVKRP